MDRINVCVCININIYIYHILLFLNPHFLSMCFSSSHLTVSNIISLPVGVSLQITVFPFCLLFSVSFTRCFKFFIVRKMHLEGAFPLSSGLRHFFVFCNTQIYFHCSYSSATLCFYLFLYCITSNICSSLPWFSSRLCKAPLLLLSLLV